MDNQARMPNRQERRAYLKSMGLLKKKSKLSFKDWSALVSKNQEEGRKIHEQNMEIFNAQVYEQLQAKENSITSNLRELGFSDAEIRQHLDSWYDKLFKEEKK